MSHSDKTLIERRNLLAGLLAMARDAAVAGCALFAAPPDPIWGATNASKDALWSRLKNCSEGNPGGALGVRHWAEPTGIAITMFLVDRHLDYCG